MKKYVYNLARIVGFIGLVCFGVLGFQNGVKAEVSYQALSYGSGNITIPDYEGDALLLCFLGLDNQYFVIDSATSSDIFSYSFFDYIYVQGSSDYFLNPKKGNNSFSVSNNYYEDNCYLITGIDGANPFSVVEGSYYDGYHGVFSNPTILSDLSPTSTNSFLFTVGAGVQDPVWSLSGYSKIRQSQRSNYQSDVSFFRVSDLNADVYSFSWNTSYWAFMKYYEVIFNSASSVVPDSQTGVWGYLNFQSKYQCNRGDSCVLRFFYNQEYIPEDTNEIRLSSGVYPDITVVATSTIEDFSLIGKSDGRSFISFDIASTTPRGTYEYFVNAEADDDSWVFSAPIYVEVFNEDEYLNPYPEMEEFEMWGSEWYFKLLSIFPFNIPTSFIIAWNNSATAELPKDLEFLDMVDKQGNFNASFPKQWLGTPADMEFTLFGYDKIVNGSSRMIVLLENFKKFTTFLQWLMFVWGFWGFAKLVIDNLNVSVVESGTENIHSFSSHSQHINALGRSSRSHSYSTGRSRTTHRSKKIRF